MNKGKIVPFGKYKGQNIETMLQDRQYIDWLLAQPWFRGEFKSWYNRIIGEAQGGNDTPIHNALQARFLRTEFILAFVRFLQPEYFGNGQTFKIDFEERGWDVHIQGTSPGVNYCVEIKPSVADDYPAVLRQIKKYPMLYGTLQATVGVHGQSVLLLEEYKGVGVTIDDFIAIFETSGIKVVFLDEIGA